MLLSLQPARILVVLEPAHRKSFRERSLWKYPGLYFVIRLPRLCFDRVVNFDANSFVLGRKSILFLLLFIFLSFRLIPLLFLLRFLKNGRPDLRSEFDRSLAVLKNLVGGLRRGRAPAPVFIASSISGDNSGRRDAPEPQVTSTTSP